MSLEKAIIRLVRQATDERFNEILQAILNSTEKNKNSFHYINQKITKMSKANDQVLAIVSEFKDETDSISARIDRILAQADAAADGAVSPEAIEELKAVSARLKTLGSDPAQPIPPAEEPAPAEPTDSAPADSIGDGTGEETPA